MRKIILLTLIALIAGFQLMNAVPAYRGKITVTQPDGTKLVLQPRGDEFGHWYTDASGRMLRQDEDGYYREMTAAEGTALRQKAAALRTSRNLARSRRAARARQNPVVGQRHFLVILVEFANLSFQEENDSLAYVQQMNLPGYSRNGATGSARDFYYDNSDGRFEPVFDVYGPVKLSQNYSYYGQNDGQGNDKHPEEAVADGCRMLDDEVDFTRYDNDGDGKVDLVFMYYAGYGEADGGASNTIWPHQWELSSAGVSLTLDGVQVDSYACSNERVGYGSLRGKMDGIGTACHEFGHAMGLPDFYDTDYGTNGEAGGLYSFSTMDNGAYNNEGRTPPYFNYEERMLLGWVDEAGYRTFDRRGTYTIPPVTDNVAYRTFTDMDGEYFVYENRTKAGWDRYIPEEGMIVYHVDKSSRRVGGRTAYSLWENWHASNAINARGDHPCFYIIPSSDQESLYHYQTVSGTTVEKPGIAFPYQGVNTYTSVSWNGVESVVSFRDIAFSGGRLTLYADVPYSDLDYITIVDAGTYTAGDRFTFALNRPEFVEEPASVAWYFDDEPVEADSVSLTAGAHVVEAVLTLKDGSRQVVTLEIEAR